MITTNVVNYMWTKNIYTFIRHYMWTNIYIYIYKHYNGCTFLGVVKVIIDINVSWYMAVCLWLHGTGRISVVDYENILELVIMVTQLCEYTENYWIVNFKWIKHMGYELYINKLTEKEIKNCKRKICHWPTRLFWILSHINAQLGLNLVSISNLRLKSCFPNDCPNFFRLSILAKVYNFLIINPSSMPNIHSKFIH